MKVELDHIGIAVSQLDESLKFFRDVLGLEISTCEEVPSQRVKAQFVSVGTATLELLEATADDSAIARFIKRKGPGLHHITLRVENLSLVLNQLRDQGVQLIDEVPRPGAEGARVAFIHPSSAHGVLVELKEI
tara:strand:- start:2579 stop:2977 length:399 start_codon:yes stop_codon:yes gene_type:complete